MGHGPFSGGYFGGRGSRYQGLSNRGYCIAALGAICGQDWFLPVLWDRGLIMAATQLLGKEPCCLGLLTAAFISSSFDSLVW